VKQSLQQSRTAILVAVLLCILPGCQGDIFYAIAQGDTARVEHMLNENPNLISARTEIGQSPLHVAVSWRKFRILELLVARGADPNVQDHTGMTPLHTAAALCQREETQWLLRHGADTATGDHFGDTPAHVAAIFGCGNVLEALIAAGANLNAKNNCGEDVAQVALRFRNEDVATLARSGAHP